LPEAALDLEPPRPEALLHHELDVDRPHEPVALVPGVGPGGVAQLRAQGVPHLAELLVVRGGEVDRVVIGGHGGAPDPDRDVVVHLACQPSSQLDGSDAGLEGAGESSLDHALQPAFESTDGHGKPDYRYTQCSNRATPNGCRKVRRPALSFPACYSGEWRNWQTRWLQVPVAARAWGFKSPLAHQAAGGPHRDGGRRRQVGGTRVSRRPRLRILPAGFRGR